jgi:hypothetical protein
MARQQSRAGEAQTTPTVQRLSDGWRLAPDPTNEGRRLRWYRALRPEAQPAPVPGIIQQVFPDYHGVAWYWVRFTAPSPGRTGERTLLRFGAVDYLAEVWLNGQAVGGHEGGETPFTLDVTAAVKPGKANLLAVRVLNPGPERIDDFVLDEIPHRNKRVPLTPGSSYNYGGLVLPVELLVAPPVRITDVFARPCADTGEVTLTITVRNDEAGTREGRLEVVVGDARGAEVLAGAEAPATLPPGDSLHSLSLRVPEHRLWSLEEPCLYRAEAGLTAPGPGDAWQHRHAVRFGFREFRVRDGWFTLNGKRVFLRSTHTGNHFPIGQVVPPTPDLMCRDLLYAKTCGYNMVRFIAGMPWPEQLDYCDEIGLMVYEECLAGWCLADSPQMAERFDRSIREMVRRDRNHPSVTIWGMLNETPDGPVFRQAVAGLGLVRSLDDTRLVLLGSGRWDCQPGIGSVSNPGSDTWEQVWGAEAPGAPPTPVVWDGAHGGYFANAGDAHVYPAVPHPEATHRFIRQLGHDTKPVFLSEYGIGSVMDVIGELRRFEQAGARPDLPDAAFIGAMVERFEADWERWGFSGVYAFPEDMLRDSQRRHMRQRRLGFDLIRSNPRLCGFNLTGMLDHAITGEGLWTLWREFKPDCVDTLRDGWAPLRWCLFITPRHGYAGRPLRVEAVLANEDVLPPGKYPVVFRIQGPEGLAWEKRVTMTLPKVRPGGWGPLAVPVLDEEVVLPGPAGAYELAACLEQGGGPLGDRRSFRLSDPAQRPRLRGSAATWGLGQEVTDWLGARGLRCRAFTGRGGRKPGVVLVGDPGETAAEPWRDLMRAVAAGGVAVFLQPAALRQDDDTTYRLPLQHRGLCKVFGDWLYHKECVARRHEVFAGLQDGGLLDADDYDQVTGHELFEGQDVPDDVICAAFALGYPCPGGYESGLTMGAYRLGAGWLVLNSLRIVEHVDQHPAADRLLLNLVGYAQGRVPREATPVSAALAKRIERLYR